ncbi:hypothetical protein PFICI_05657 [Pestalotiopsis fici W106-1]|uniref:Ig-like domain-containing protein n=1 Tax=Pestalotiopsis fici (strain W106-1 / CGMCC3.15140) TaxID=1229662 RepID=W3XF24_PESFW|nr:uncharacterized protein PFICI_05657 [Pestalotiopsis fici W106-1]ETS83781.1 hypothetical protein PFICI_05657 [Pestalotiopsis fici W106-1]
MLLVSRKLLCLAALLCNGLDQAVAAPHMGHVERRLASNNQTAASIIESSGTTVPDSNPSSTSIESTSITEDGVVTARLSVASVSTSSTVSTSSGQGFALHGGLGSITTVARPTTFTLGLGTAATTSQSSSQTSRETSATSSETLRETSTASSETSSVATSSDSSTSSAASLDPYPISYINASSTTVPSITLPINSTVYELGWNSTATISGEPTIITTEPPLITTSYDVLTLSTPTDEQTVDSCDVTTNSNTVTVWSTIYTTTITWTLPPEQYTPPYPTTTSTPIICADTTGRFSVSKCEGSACTQLSYPVGATSVPHVDPTATKGTTTVAASNSGGRAGEATITFYTTDKNPAVVYSSRAPPDYGDDGTTQVQDHNTPDNNDAATDVPQYEKGTTTVIDAGATGGSGAAAPGGNGGAGNGGAGNGGAAPTSPAPVQQPPSPTSTAITVIIQTTQVIINDQTFTDSPQSKTETVVVGTDTFVINPSEVIGAGATVARPALGGVFMTTATTTTIAGVQVVYTPVGSAAANGGSTAAVATIDGTVFTLGPTTSTAVVKGQTITLGPGGIAFASQTIPIVTAAGGATESAVLGGEMITAIGNSVVVVHGTTITYGPDTSPITQVIDGDTVVIGPSGVTVHGITFGGPTAALTATTYEIVGGATITEIGGSAVVIEGTTYLIGAGAATAITTVVDGQTLTIGPSGVAMSSYTFAQPYATSTVIEPGGTSSVAAATTTAESMGSQSRPNWSTGIIGMCIAIGVGFVGGLIL